MRQTTGTRKSAGGKIIKDIKRVTRTQHPSKQKIKIVLAGRRGKDSLAELCRREGISRGIYLSPCSARLYPHIYRYFAESVCVIASICQ